MVLFFVQLIHCPNKKQLLSKRLGVISTVCSPFFCFVAVFSEMLSVLTVFSLTARDHSVSGQRILKKGLPKSPKLDIQ